MKKTSTNILKGLLVFIGVSTIGLVMYSQRSTLPGYATPNATYIAEVAARGKQPPGWIQKDGIVYRNMECECSTSGEYIGAVPCNEDVVWIVPTVYPITVNEYCKDKGVAVGLGTPTIIPRAVTETPLPSTVTPVPPAECVRVVWDKGSTDYGLNLRPGASMFNEAHKRSYLGPGLIFEPLQVATNWQGTFAEFGRGWWVAMDLTWNSDVYAEFVSCP